MSSRYHKSKKKTLRYLSSVRTLVILMLFLLILIPLIVVGVFYYITDQQPKNQIKSYFEKIPGVKVTSISSRYGNTTVLINNSGIITFNNLLYNPSSLKNPTSIAISQIGPYSPIVYFKSGPLNTDYPSQHHTWIYFGSMGEFNHLFPLDIRYEADVINNYNEILKTIETWPDATGPHLEPMLSNEDFCFYSKRNYGYDILENEQSVPDKCNRVYDNTLAGQHRVKIYYGKQLIRNK